MGFKMAILVDEFTGQTIVESKVATVDITKYGTNQKSEDIEVPRAEYTVHQESMDLIDSLLGGTKTMLAAGTKYLPKETAESAAAYQNRLRRTVLFNAFGRTISYLSGQVFSTEVMLGEDVPSEIRGDDDDGFQENIDLRGNDLTTFLKDVFESGISHGTTCVLVDYPNIKMQGVVTVEDERQYGLRPYWVHIPTSAIIGWKTKEIRGRTVFTQLRIKEVVEYPDPESRFKVVKRKRIRVLEPGRWELWEYKQPNKNASEEWILIASGVTTIKFIPLAVFQPGDKLSALTARPPLEDLAYMNLSHWQSSSDQMNILHFTRLPILFGRKITAVDKLNEIEIGANRMIHSDHIEGELKYVEHTGRSIGAGQAHLTDLETKMAMWGLQLLMPKTGTITATEKALASGESDSTLKAWALTFEDFIEQLLLYTASYLRKDQGGSAEVNKQFRWMQTLDAEVLLRGAQFGVLPKRLVFEELQRRGIVSDDYDYVDVQAMFDEESRGATFTPGGFADIANKYLSTNTAPDRSMSAVTSPYAIKRGSGRKGGV